MVLPVLDLIKSAAPAAPTREHSIQVTLSSQSHGSMKFRKVGHYLNVLKFSVNVKFEINREHQNIQWLTFLNFIDP